VQDFLFVDNVPEKHEFTYKPINIDYSTLLVHILNNEVGRGG